MPVNPKILLYAPRQLPRLAYSAHYLLEDLLGFSLEYTSNQAVFRQFAGPKIYYHTATPPTATLQLIPHRLLTTSTISDPALVTGLYEGIPTVGEVPPDGALPFDPFAATFYLLSRYEEYLPYTADAHDRFPAAVAWAARANCLEQPIVWQWALALWKQLQRVYPRLDRPERTYRFEPTYDVDLPWAFRYRGIRGVARAGLELLGRQWALSQRRLKVLRGREVDPFFTFDYLKALHHQHDVPARFFWLVAAERSHYDVNPNTELAAFRQLIQDTTDWADCGLHPSYASYQHPSLLVAERQELRRLSAQEITHSRQHYLRLRLPDTYHQLLAAGIRHDYSMGFADAVGYRAGTSEPFYWFDLKANQVTDLKVHPFVAMDVSLRKYQQLSPDQAAEQLRTLRTYCRTEGLTFSTLWHNSSFSDVHGWEGWASVYEALFDE